MTDPNLFTPRDQHVDAIDAPRLSEQARRVLDRLRRGPATNAELAGIANRFGARLYDLRRSGFTITTSEAKDGSGLVWYRLTGEPNGA